MAYRGLGRRTNLGVQDGLATSGNPFLPTTGWNVVFTPADLASNLTEFEVYQISLNGPVGSSLLVAINQVPWNYVNQGWLNAWDPNQAMLLSGGDEVEFFWNVPFTTAPYDQVSNIQPTVTLWLRHEESSSALA